jgi:hypothetical protein
MSSTILHHHVFIRELAIYYYDEDSDNKQNTCFIKQSDIQFDHLNFDLSGDSCQQPSCDQVRKDPLRNTVPNDLNSYTINSVTPPVWGGRAVVSYLREDGVEVNVS